MTDLSKRLEQLSPAKRALLEKLARQGAAPAAPSVVSPRRGDGPVPLSSGQHRLWFLDRLEPGTPLYTIPAVYRLRGAVDPAALQRALAGVVARHESLRTVFAAAEGEDPVQVVLPPSAFPLETDDLRSLPAGEREAEALARARDWLRAPFDLAAGPLVRALLARTGDAEWLFAVAVHHVVSDGWSQGILFRELGILYAAETVGGAAPLPAPALQYPDFAAWQREWLRGPEVREQLAWWRERLADLPPALELPADRPRPAAQSFRGAKHVFTLPPELADALGELARSEGATLFMVLLAGFQLLLSRYTGEEDVVVGSPVAGRNRAETEGIVGFFVNTLVLRTDLGGDPTFRELLGRVRESTLGAYAHQDLPFEKLVEELRPDRSLHHNPLFQVLFALQNAAADSLRLGDAEAELVISDLGVAIADLDLILAQGPAGVRGVARYRTDLFDAGTIERLFDRYAALLRAAVEAPDRHLSEIPLLDAGERARVLEEWSRDVVPYRTRTVHRLFAEQAARTPDAPAVVSGGERLTYAELDRRANRLAHLLRARGAGPETRVGVCLERSVDTLAAVLGILKAGGAYVPLDPAYPAERLAWILEDAAIPLLVTSSGPGAALPPHAAEVVLLDAESELLAAQPADAPEDVAEPEGLAYVIYTSGSTGRPRGVLVEHRSLCGFLLGAGERLGLGAGDVVPGLASYAFDIWGLEALAPLVTGATARVVAAERGVDVERLLEEARDATVLHAVPALMRQVVETARTRGGALPALRLALTGGDQVPADLLAGMRGAFPGAGIQVLYGPTEGTVLASSYPVPAEGASGRYPIGRPVPNAALYVCDPRGSLLPDGIPGELYVGGAGVARGYLGRPELTAERFVPDPFGGEPGARLYRTGDRARWTAEGTLEFVGRTDEQVKIRGFRIEPGEVEAVLAGHPGVRETAVVARGDGDGEVRLVAYAVPAAESAVSARELRTFLAERLPDYMVPAAVVLLDSFPLTPGGKVDRRALPAPDEAAEPREHAEPRTPTEEILAGIWAEVLGTGTVGIQDDFFELGGHSLRAYQAISRVRALLGVELPLRGIFEAPTVAAMAERVETARREREGTAFPAPAPAPRADGDELPLSFAQERLWFLYRMEPASSAYNMPFALRLRGELDVAALRVTLNGLAARHEALRTVFAPGDEHPVQRVLPASPVPLPVEDLSGLSEAERGPAARKLMEAEAQVPFDLERGPVFRARLLRLSAGENVLVLCMHHIVSDGWSMGVLFRELGELYAAVAGGRPSPLAPLPVQYADFAVWQHDWLRGETLERQVEWWRERLAGAPPVLELPTDRPRPVSGSHPGAWMRFEVPAATAAGLRALARAEGSTLFAAVLGAFQLLLARYSGEEDVVVGTPSAGRGHWELEGVVGFFVNTLPMRSGLSDDPTFRQLLGRVRDAVLGAHTHQDVPFDRLAHELRLDRSAGRNPLFQVMFTYRSGAMELPELPGLAVSMDEVEARSAKFDLSAELEESAQGMAGALVYDAELFDAATIERMAGHLVTLVERIVAGPDARLSEHSLLGAGERRLLEEWNDTAWSVPGPLRAHDLVAAQARRSPDAPAILASAGSVSYRELDARANRLARRLADLGVRPEMPVALCLEASPELLVAVLAILRAGGAYLPLDPAYPPERLRTVLEDAAAPLLLTRSHLADRLPGHGARVVCLDAEAERIARESAEPVDGGALPESLAYMIYTSGSTGKPKGVRVEHRSLVNLLLTGREAFSLGEGDVTPALSSFAFDIWLFEALVPLAFGGATRLVPRDRVAEVEWLVREIADATVLHAVPALMRQIVAAAREAGTDALPGLRQAFVGGDAVPPDLLAEMRDAFPGATVRVLYGPTEGTVICAAYAVPEDGAVERPMVGAPLPGARLYVVDRTGSPVPIGVPGELCIGGRGVSRGYFCRPDLTAEKFVPDALGGEAGARLYRTGDRMRWRVDGTLEFLGRTDNQVKIRGFRIEPGEIEAVLCEHAAVRDAVVLAREDEPGERRLVGYVVARDGEAAAGGDLRGWLRERLPEHMVPSALVLLDAFPLTPTGKVDRRALPAPEAAGPEGGYVAPRDAVEEILAGIWGEVLGVERVGVNESFFDLGGHSLLATRVVTRIRAAFGVEVQLRALFEHPTVARLAQVVREEHGDGAPPIVPRDRSSAPPLSFAQQRLWFLDRMEPVNPYYNIPFSIRLTGPLDVALLERALAEVVRRHESLRTIFRDTGGEPEQRVLPAIPSALAVEELSDLPAAEREDAMLRRAVEEARLPFDLEAGPLFRARLLRLAPREHVLLLTIHHIVSDAWSFGILYREVSELYRAFARGEPSPLPELPVQYGDFAVWQRDWLTGETLDRQLAYWRDRLAGAPPLLELPLDRPRPPVQTHGAGRHQFVLPVPLAESLKALGRAEGATLFMVLLAGLNAVLRRYSGEDDVVVGTPIAGRTRAETEAMIGFFVNMLPLRVDLAGDPSFRELLARVRETTLGAYAHQDVPFERVIEDLRLQRSLSHSAVYQVAIVLHNTARNGIDIPDVEAEPIDIHSWLSAFDLALGATEKPEGLLCALIFNSDLFDEATVAAMGHVLRQVLEGAAADPARSLSELSPLPEEERQLQLARWNATARDLPTLPVHERFRLRARHTPTAPAVVQEGAELLTYAELERRSNRLAHTLARHGVGPETRVGLCLERSPQMLVAVLATLKAGGVYVPLDPTYPAERLAHMLDDSAARVVLAQGDLAGVLPATGAEIVLVDGEGEGGPDAPPAAAVEAESAAYVIYTSGSTGRPKGVLVSHGALASYAGAAVDLYGVTPADRVLQFASLSFDASAEEIYPALLGGATLVLRTEEMLGSAETFLARVEGWGVTVLDLPTAYWHELAAALERGEARLPGCVRLVIIGGERALPERVAAWRRRVGSSVRLVNTYGPTETTVVATLADLTESRSATAAPEQSQPPVPIGGPVPNVRVYVLDARMEPVPVGARGELYIGGAGVARGYLGRPELTAERFVPDPFSAETGARLYRSGDVVRWRRDGELEYLGRADEQVKVRGFRVELGEIESLLLRHPAVREAVVAAREDEPGRTRLVGYVVAAGEAPPAGALREHLKGELPEYMVPGAFVVLDELPLTPSGKVDRRALPAPEIAASETYVAPRTPAEESLCGIWAEVLRVERVGVGDNFFELGGHSLLATQVVARMRAAWGVEVPLRAIFEHPTVGELAALLPREPGAVGPDPDAERIGVAAAGLEEDLLGRMDEMSDAEIERLLAGLSAEESLG